MESHYMESNCRLCGNKSFLKKSHILPCFAYKWLKKTSGTGFMRLSDNPDKRAQDGYKLYWLCSDCEARFSIWETKFANNIFHLFVNDELTKSVTYGDWLVKFCVSVSWRVLNFYLDNSMMNHFSKSLMDKVCETNEIYKDFLFDKIPNPRHCEQHLIPFREIVSYQNRLDMPLNINRYILRTVDQDVVCAVNNDAFVYSKLGRFVIIGFINMSSPKNWEGTKLHIKHGVLEPSSSYNPPPEFKQYFKQKAKSLSEAYSQISDQEIKKIEKFLYDNPEQVEQSESFKAMNSDYQLFGPRVFGDKN